MTDNTKWLRHVETKKPHIVGEFENEHGERYVIYRNQGGDKPYITGDELDWTIGHGLLWNSGSFMFNSRERDQIARILWPTWDDAREMLQMRLDAGETREEIKASPDGPLADREVPTDPTTEKAHT